MLQLALVLSLAAAGLDGGRCAAAPLGIRYFTLPLTGAGMATPGVAVPPPACAAGQVDFCDANSALIVLL